MRGKLAKAMRKAVYGKKSIRERKYIVTEYRKYQDIDIPIPEWETFSRSGASIQSLDPLQAYAENNNGKVTIYNPSYTIQAVQHRGIYLKLKQQYKRKRLTNYGL